MNQVVKLLKKKRGVPMREDNRTNQQIRPIKITRPFIKHPHGSVLIEYGDTKVICTVSLEDHVPRFLKDTGKGWLTAEYAMLPASTNTRVRREVSKGKVSGRSSEIQRLIGRSLRAAVDLEKLGERSLMVDADVLQADGGTRTAAITGSMIALWDAVQKMLKEGDLETNPIKHWLAAISVGKVNGQLMTDLAYCEDSQAELDMNLVLTEKGEIVEIQGTAEQEAISIQELNELVSLGQESIDQILSIAKAEVGLTVNS